MKLVGLGLLSAVLLSGANATVTFYNDRDQYLAALGSTNIIEASTRRTSKGFWADNNRIQERDYKQCGLTFQWGGETDHMNYIQTRFGYHSGNRNVNGDKAFNGNAVWYLWLKDTVHKGYTIKTEHPFYAMGFDFAGSGSPQFGIKIFGEDVQYFDMPCLHCGAPAQFLGLISDGEPVNEFEIEALPGRTNIHSMAFTNVAYATPDDDALTSVGCYNTNTATRTCWATGWGDPHLITWDGLKYDVHAKGEVIMTKSMDSDFQIQARLEGLRPAGDTAGPAVTTGVVVRDPGFPTLQVNVASSNSAASQMFAGCPLDLYVDEVAKNITSWPGVSGARVIMDSGAGKVIVEYLSSNVRLDIRVKIHRNKCYFTVDCLLADCYGDQRLIGLLGSPDGNKTNDWMTQEDEVIPLPEGDVSKFFFEPAYNYSVNNWCTRSDQESLFAYEVNQNFATFAHCGNAYDDTLEQIMQNIPEGLDDICKGDIGCLMDGEELGEEAAEEYMEDPAVTRTQPPTFSPTPPPTTPPPPTVSPREENAAAQGDPHFKTWKNEHFEFHGQCDIVLAKDTDFADGLGLQVHIRTGLVRFWSYIKSAAILIDNDILEIEGSTNPEDPMPHFWFNYEYRGEAETIGGFPISIQQRNFEIDLGRKFPGQKIVISTFREFVAMRFLNASEQSFGKTVGILGDFVSGDTLARDGTTVMDDYAMYGNEWQVLPGEGRLFHEIAEPQFPRPCMMPEDPRGNRRRRLGESSISLEDAETACSKVVKDSLDLKDCVYDILATQDLDMVGAF